MSSIPPAWLFPDDPRRRARRDRRLAVLFALASLLLVARAARKEAGVLVRNQEWGARFLERRDPYFDEVRGERIHGPYPPSYAWVTAPLSMLPRVPARIVWAGAQIAALAGSYLVLRSRTRALWPELAPHAPALFAVAVLLVSRFLLRDMQGGGGNLIYSTLALCALELVWRGRERAGGACLALALVLKPNLLPLALFLAVRRRRRALASTAAAGVLLYCAPALSFGWAGYAELTRGWARSVVAYARAGDLRDPEQVPAGMPVEDSSMNQALRPALDRLLRPSDAARIDDVHLAELEPAAIAAISRAAVLLLALATCAVAARARGGPAELFAALAFFPLAHLASPISWKAHHVALLGLFYALACAAAQPPQRRWLWWSLAAYYLLCDLASEELLGKAAKNWLQAVSLVTWFDVAWLIVTLGLVRASGGASLAPPPSRRRGEGHDAP